MDKIKVYINSKEPGKRQVIETGLIKKRAKTILVKLPDGNIIKRKNKDIVSIEEKK